jgi:hypothetical protein
MIKKQDIKEVLNDLAKKDPNFAHEMKMLGIRRLYSWFTILLIIALFVLLSFK